MFACVCKTLIVTLKIHATPSGIMFNADIRETCMKVMNKYRLVETIPSCVDFIKTMKPHGSQARIFRILDVLTSYGKLAKPTLPDSLH